MWIINFSKANCKNCYACARVCPVHAIEVKDEQAKIMRERCIGCGKCLKVCPQNAKQVKSEIEKVKTYMYQGKKVVASLAPAFVALFETKSYRLITGLKQLGFSAVEETVIGAELVTQTYGVFGSMPGDQCYITSCCPTVNALIQKHYPEMLPYLIPVISPATCHAKLLKQKYGKDTKVIFIGPCISKKIEGIEEEDLDAVLTFEELFQWFEKEKIQVETLEETPFEEVNIRQRGYPIVGGVTQTISTKEMPRKILRIHGIGECIDMISYIKNGGFKNTLLEVHGCRHSCLAGPGMPQDGTNIYERRERVKTYAQWGDNEIIEEDGDNEKMAINLHKEFLNLKKELKKPTEEEIEAILSSIGKETRLDELNCGSCGYHTCREKAVAVYNGIAEATMCLPFMRQKAETLTNVIFETTPNLIIMVDKNLQVLEINPAAKKFFGAYGENLVHESIQTILPVTLFEQVIETKQNILNHKSSIGKKGATVIENIIWSDYHQVMLWIANDITRDEKMTRQIQNMKIEAIDMAQQVINKQMTVAQEIASLLGETTAETKVTLTKLKKLIQEEEDLGQ